MVSVSDALEWAKEVDAQLTSLRHENEMLQESLADRILAAEDVGWKVISGYAANDDDTGLTLDNLHDLSEKLREYAASNPWHVRGAQLRHSYIFGRGMDYVDLTPRSQKVLDDAHNKSVFGSVDAYEAMNLACFTDGAFILMLNEASKTFTQIPIKQIQGVITNPDDAMDIWYIKRVWNANGKPQQVWLPLSRHKRVRTIQRSIVEEDGAPRVAVAQDRVVYIKHTKRQTGWTWGVPDSFAAYIWTMAYSDYLRDAHSLSHALTKFAWTITKASSSGTDRAAAQIARPGVGGTTLTGDGNSVASVGVPSAQVNMNNGQPLIAAVAASFGVPTIALISSPGATGGSYGAATTLDQPTLKGFEALQDSWTLFFEEILHDLGAKKASIEFPSIENDAVYRQITSIGTGVELGLIHRDEGREAVLNLLDVPKLHDDVPDVPDAANVAAVMSGQGTQGAIPGGQEQGITNHENDE